MDLTRRLAGLLPVQESLTFPRVHAVRGVEGGRRRSLALRRELPAREVELELAARAEACRRDALAPQEVVGDEAALPVRHEAQARGVGRPGVQAEGLLFAPEHVEQLLAALELEQEHDVVR